MRFNIIYVISLVMAFALASCNDEDLITGNIGGGEAAVSPLRFEVSDYSVNASSRSSVPSENPEPESESEKKIRDFWLFQFKPDGSQLAAPAYYSISSNSKTLTDLTTAAYGNLTKNTPMTIYVVTNTGDPTWAATTDGTVVAGFGTLDELKTQKLKSPFPIQAGVDRDNDGKTDDIYIPMSGQLDNVTVTDKTLVTVPVTRMYAKVKIQANFPDNSLKIYYVDISGVPYYCRVTTLVNDFDANGEPAAVSFPEGTRMWSSALTSGSAIDDGSGSKWIVLYIPENIRGEIADADKSADKSIPQDALTVNISAKYNGDKDYGTDFYYTVYPGENETNNFNIRRNCVYRVCVDVQKITDQHNPSSNCFIVKPGEKLSFEPYNRAETGGGYKISTYLDPNVSKKAIAYTKIIWQTKDCIGDNSDGKLVYYKANEQVPQNSKIIIEKTGVEGNALVGAYNSDDEIIWSWHIWVTPNEPDNLANAVVYTTYRWDSKGIYNNDPRVPGYGIMPCNLGALAFRSSGTDMSGYSISPGNKFPDSQIRTFGMLYQWGRKDPFPPMIYSTGTEDSNGTLEYTNIDRAHPGVTDFTGIHYANDNETIVNKTSDYNNANDTTYLFRSVIGGNISKHIEYAIANPTIYISGTKTGNDAYNNKNGDWSYDPNTPYFDSDGLWGGTKGSGGFAIKEDNSVKAHLYDNYGEKSIFDPCPKGWRVPPGDLWLGFTSTGLNPTVEELKWVSRHWNWEEMKWVDGHWEGKSNYEYEVNYCSEESGYRPGMSMYVQAWRKGPTVYFPLQGTRIYNGRCSNTGLCGNYHNATCDDDGRVNILHLHRNMDIVSNWTGDDNGNILFMIFEYKNQKYYSKSTAGPIRCVRETR